MSSPMRRRRFLALAASAAAASAAIACGGSAPSTPLGGAKPAGSPDQPKPAAGADAKPTAAAPAPAAQPTVALKVDAAAPAAATAAPATAATKPAEAAKPAAGKYKEAPQLAQLVQDGKLPPVEQRLPDNPRVLKPLEEVGQYGGTWHRAYRGLSDRWGPTKLVEEFLIEWDMPDPNTIKLAPNFAEKWEQNKDATEFTFYLRKGVKWSDGKPVSVDDMKICCEDYE